MEKYDAKEVIKNTIEELVDINEASLQSDLLNSALSSVNWYELAEEPHEVNI